MKEAKPGEVVLEGGNATIGAPVIKAAIRSANQPREEGSVELTVRRPDGSVEKTDK